MRYFAASSPCFSGGFSTVLPCALETFFNLHATRIRTMRPIPVYNGILEHRPRIAHALWEFLWCLDKITEESDGIGWVFRKAPVKVKRIAADLHAAEKTVRINLARLEKYGYIQRTRTPAVTRASRRQQEKRMHERI